MSDKTKPGGCVLAFRNDRLGARLNAILTAMRISRRYDVPMKVFWSLTEESSAELQSPGDLFSADFIDSTFLSQDEGRRAMRGAIELAALRDNVTEAKFLKSFAKNTTYLSNSATDQTLLPWEDRAELNLLPELLTSLPLTPVVREAIARIDAALGQTEFQSYHLRRGDIIDDSAPASHNLWPNKYIPRVFYEWHMKRELTRGRGKLVIFSDAQDEAAVFAGLSPRIASFSDLLDDETLTLLQTRFPRALHDVALVLHLCAALQRIFRHGGGHRQ